MNGSMTKITARTRILVVDHNNVYTSLVVDEVFGMKHFMNDEYVAREVGVEEFVKPEMRNGCQSGERNWGLLSVDAL